MGQDLVVRRDSKYEALKNELKTTLVQAGINSRLVLVEGYWLAGKMIREVYKTEKITSLLQSLAVDIGQSERTLWYAVQFYDKYPKFELVPEGNNISWNKIITKYLPAKKQDERDIEKCVICGEKKYADGQINTLTLPAMTDDGETYYAHKPCLWKFLNENL